jgi:hypothetical protein
MSEYIRKMKNGEEVAFYSGDKAIGDMEECLKQLYGVKRAKVNLGIERIKEIYTHARTAAIKFGLDITEYPKTLRLKLN